MIPTMHNTAHYSGEPVVARTWVRERWLGEERRPDIRQRVLQCTEAWLVEKEGQIGVDLCTDERSRQDAVIGRTLSHLFSL